MRFRILSLCYASAAFLLLIFPSRATINIDVATIEKSIVFLYPADAKGAVDKSTPIGTGFLVGVRLKSDPAQMHSFLVTARHMFDPRWAKCGGANPSIVYMRLNTKNYVPGTSVSGFEYVPLRLTDHGSPTWAHSTKEDVDAAVLPLHETELSKNFDFTLLPPEMFASDAELATLGIGDPVASAGLMVGMPGVRRNYPIFKFGQISNIPQEDVETHCSTHPSAFLEKVWLIAANLIAGNSGSPIFYVPLGGSGTPDSHARPMLIGVQSMFFDGQDVAGMTPINLVYDIFESMVLPDADLHRSASLSLTPDPK